MVMVAGRGEHAYNFSLSGAPGKKWHSRRKLLTPTFHFRILEQFVDVFNEKGTILEAKLESLIGKGAVDVRPYISRHALDVICGKVDKLIVWDCAGCPGASLGRFYMKSHFP